MLKLDKNYISRTTIALTLLIGLASCRQQDEVPGAQMGSVVLTPDVVTKGSVTTTANIGEFTAFGYSHGRRLWADIGATATSNLMFNNKYTKTGNAWIGNTQTQWPDNEFDRYSFFAYSPTASAANQVSLLTSASTAGYQRLSYQTVADVRGQVDLLLAARLDQTPINEVPLSFKHALSRVGFTVYTDKPGTTVKSISINGVRYKGEIDVRADATWVPKTDKTNFTATINSGEISTDVDNPTSMVGANGEHYFMLLPQNLTSNTDVATCITVVITRDSKDKTINYTIKQNYEQGKAILYKLEANNNISPKIDWTVTDWTTTNIPTDIAATYLNVSALSGDKKTTFVYQTDYTGVIKVEESGTTGKLVINHDAANKKFTVSGTELGDFKVTVTAGKLSRVVKVTIT